MASSSTIPTNSTTVQSGYVRHTPGGEHEDIAWRFNHWQDLSKKKSVTCNFCLETFTGGISRARKHQLGIPGEVKKCRKTPADAKAILQADYD
ncbi:AT-hook motif nuclear-localized protein [Trifolium repens]|nr:AT-hook motif nuclear-localized protein [Trifolium repens]